METSKRRKDKNSDEEERRNEKRSKRARTRSRSPAGNRERDSRRKRRHSKSKSPGIPAKQEKQTSGEKEPDVKKEAPARRAKETDMLNTRTGGAYIPPARLRMMQAQITDKSSVAYQRLAWEALKKSIHGHINKINVGNIGIIIKELLKENIVRGRGLLCRSVIQAQAASPTFTNVYAALVAAVNSRFPNIGELLLKRLVIQFKRGFKRNDKSICISSASFIAHLVNQRVAHEILALELLTLLVETPTDDSVEVAIAFLKECGQKLTEVSSKGVNAIFEMLRNILHEGQLDKRVQYMIEVMFQVWKDGFKDHPALIEELELVPEEEQFTHLLMLDEATDPQDILNVFKFDDKYEENEQKYKTLSKEILGSDAESGDEDSSGESGSEEDDDDEEQEQKEVTIIDNTETNLVALRRTIYLTINSSLDFEECAHKLMKMQLKPGQEVELCHMFLDCCAEQRTYEKFYGLLAQRFCNINRIYIGPFEEIFKDSYGTAHRLDTNRLRNVSKFFAHLLFTDSISWEVLECVKLNEEDTTSSSRIYIKILFQELAEYMGLKKLNDRLKDPTLQDAFSGLFPRDNPKNTRFSINFFTSIGLGGLTDELREHLKQMPKNVPPPVTEIKLDSESSSDSSSDSSSSSSSSSSDSSSSDDEEEKSKKKKSKKTKSKEKDVETLAEQVAKDKNDRWGHDGFYETYGKDARRTESRPDRQDREDFARPRDRRNEQGNGDERRGNRNNSEQYNDDLRRNRSRDDFRDRRDNGRQQRDEGRNRNDDRGNDREIRGRYDDRSRRNEERDDRITDRVRRDDERMRNNDRSKEDDRYPRNDDRNRKDDDRQRKDNERSHKDDERRRNDDRGRKGDEFRDSRGHRDDDRNRDDNEKANRGNENKGRKDERSRKDDDRGRVDEDRSYRNGDKGRKNDDRTRRGDEVEERSRKGDERSRRDDDRSQRADERDYRNDRSQKVDEKERRGDDRIRRDVDDFRSKKKVTEDKSERDSSRRKERDDEKVKDIREEHDSRSKKKYDERSDRYQNGEDRKDYKNSNKTKEDEEEKSKKTKHDKKSKKDKKKEKKSSKDDNSDSDDEYVKKKEKNRKDKQTDSDSSSSSDDETPAPGRYWDNFDVKGKEISMRELKVNSRNRRERS